MKNNKPPRVWPDFEGSLTAPRFSFSNRELLRQDYIQEVSFRPKRRIVYPTPVDPEQLSIRDSMTRKNFLLGHQEPKSAVGTDCFSIPLSARPISYDASTERGGDYSYNDKAMFADIGHLLGQLAILGPDKPVVLNRNIGLNIAIVEFTKVDEPKILLVPGFETDLKSASNQDEAVNSYAVSLYDEFGEQFARQASEFINSFREVTS